jgi:pimeloyl-ACP methyl ester carboxylesterase
MNGVSSRLDRVALALASLCLLAACEVGDFFFAGVPAEPYRFDEIDPQLAGDLSSPHPSIVPASLREEGFVTSRDGTSVHWVLARQREGPARATVLYSHGNGPNLGRFWDRVEILWQLGYQVLIYDYPGFGRSSGEASEPGMYEAASSALALVAARDDVDPARLILYGHSLGSAATFELASRALRGEVIAARGAEALAVRPAAVITESAWCSIEEMIRDGTFLDLPGELLSHLRFDNCARIAELREVPVMLLHGERDRIVPMRQLALLEGRAARPPIVHRVPNATHVDVSIVGTPRASIAAVAGVPRPSEEYAGWLMSLAAP